ncbi:ABC transporter permease [Candidatus Venteria ishoeyi]|nr:ABC transporter permease [Candidatus Venteria ishoeyi]MDM8544884.1 ABC transporter permease [Candidatus Venteria ishoeyi]
MFSYFLKNIFQRLLLLFVVSILAHAVVHLAPGQPSEVDPHNPRMQAEDIQRIRDAFHLDAPLHLQYYYWMSDLLSGELKSFKDSQPVLPKIRERFLNSLPLFILATVLIWTLSFPVGIHAALHRGSLYDRSSTLIAWLLISIPGFFLAYLLILWVVQTVALPVLGMRTFGMEQAGLWAQNMDKIWHLTLPALLSAAAGIAVLSRYVRAQMLETLNQDYVRTARAKGLDEHDVVYHHALRNALLPFITMFGLMLPGLIGGSVIIEQIFAWPGIGRLSYEAIMARDFPVILTINFFAAVLTLAGTFLSDMLYALADPRIRL